MGLGGVISNLLSIGAKLLPVVTESAQTPSSSSSPPAESHQIEADLKRLMKMVEQIKAILYDAEEREIRDRSVKLWLRELRGVAYDAEDVLDEYNYEVLRAQVEARDASTPNPHKRKQVQMPDDMSNQIKHIKERFDEICKDRVALRLFEEDGPRRCNNELQIVPTSHCVVESDIFGREREKEELIDLLSSECHDGNVSVVTIVGTGGLGKTTLAQLAYNDERIRDRFHKFGWICVSVDFNVQRLTRELFESITKKKCELTNLSAMQEEIGKVIRGQKVLLVLDDVWNEKGRLWESFRAPFMSATLVKILVTTRNEYVARIMQTMPTFKLGYLSEEHCWQLFHHYAFGDVNRNKGLELVEIGKQIMRKCGMLPLAVKSIASLLRHEAEEDWREILKSELWESDASSEIFPPLQISYARLPTYLKPCFLYCSMFPKDYHCRVEKLVQLWIYQGYIESNGKKDIKQIGEEYVKKLWERSFLESVYQYESGVFKLHDMVHDLARFNSENGYYSIEVGKVPDFSKELYHLYVDHAVELVEPLPSGQFTALRTLIMCCGVENFYCTFDFSKAQTLRTLELRSQVCELEFLSSIVNLKHLRYLSLEHLPLERLPECICSLYSLQNLTLRDCCNLLELPKRIGNLVSLEELVIDGCSRLRVLPMSLCQVKVLTRLILRCSKLEELPTDMGNLTSLRTLRIALPNRVRSPPPSLTNLTGIQTLQLQLECETMEWLKDFVNLKGTLRLGGLNHMVSLSDVRCANIVSMHNLECLELCWNRIVPDFSFNWDGNEFLLNIIPGNTCPDDFSLMDRLQPHQNLRELSITYYGGTKFPNWIGDPTSCASLEKIEIYYCNNLTFLQFGSLCKLKYLTIFGCSSLYALRPESLPLELQELVIFDCGELISVLGIQNLKSLVKLQISSCENLLHLLVTDAGPSFERTMCTNKYTYQNSLVGLRNLASLRSLQIERCPRLQLFEDELLPVESCQVEVSGCPGLKEWCLQHNISYKELPSSDGLYGQMMTLVSIL